MEHIVYKKSENSLNLGDLKPNSIYWVFALKFTYNLEFNVLPTQIQTNAVGCADGYLLDNTKAANPQNLYMSFGALYEKLFGVNCLQIFNTQQECEQAYKQAIRNLQKQLPSEYHETLRFFYKGVFPDDKTFDNAAKEWEASLSPLEQSYLNFLIWNQ